ncbi:hypothetical protein LEMLEM_LOCUS9085, partial [Lemmus lemmus]
EAGAWPWGLLPARSQRGHHHVACEQWLTWLIIASRQPGPINSSHQCMPDGWSTCLRLYGCAHRRKYTFPTVPTTPACWGIPEPSLRTAQDPLPITPH